jgi:hypothetical protein
MNLNQFQDKLHSMSNVDFERFVVDILKSTGRFSDIKQSVLVDNGSGYVREFDIVAESINIGSPPHTWYFCKYPENAGH